MGSYLRGPHRLLTDARMFATKRRHKGASVLVDYSGSMNLKEMEVERILANAPATVIAVYPADRDRGILRVLARDGRRVTGDWVKRPSGSCKVIDGPALDWLGKQPEPRFWMSDGLVTGVGDASGIGNADYAQSVCGTGASRATGRPRNSSSRSAARPVPTARRPDTPPVLRAADSAGN